MIERRAQRRGVGRAACSRDEDSFAFSAATIDKGETKRGVIFEVPKSVKADGLRFHIDAPVGANDSVEIRLK